MLTDIPGASNTCQGGFFTIEMWPNNDPLQDPFQHMNNVMNQMLNGPFGGGHALGQVRCNDSQLSEPIAYVTESMGETHLQGFMGPLNPYAHAQQGYPTSGRDATEPPRNSEPIVEEPDGEVSKQLLAR